jgi:hypothetical protein
MVPTGLSMAFLYPDCAKCAHFGSKSRTGSVFAILGISMVAPENGIDVGRT